MQDRRLGFKDQNNKRSSGPLGLVCPGDYRAYESGRVGQTFYFQVLQREAGIVSVMCSSYPSSSVASFSTLVRAVLGVLTAHR